MNSALSHASPSGTVKLPAGYLEGVQTELAYRSLHEFVRQAWHILEPATPFMDNWHIGAICEHLEAVARGDMRRLLINIPPGFAKSLSVCVFWFCWTWLRWPASRWIFTSYSEGFAYRDSGKCRTLIKSDWFQSRWGDKFSLVGDATGLFNNDKTGFRLATSVSGGGTGARADFVVTDDPLKISDADSKAMREGVNSWWDQVMVGRGVDPRTSRFVVVMQRLHEDDLTGHLNKQGGYECLFIPMEFESQRRCVTSIWQDPRKEDGELAWPDRFTIKEVADWKKRLLGYGTAGQLQQRPAPIGEGGIFNREKFRYFSAETDAGGDVWFAVYREASGDPTYRVKAADCYWFQTVDTAMKTGQENDYTAIGTFALTPRYDLLVYDVVRDRLPMPVQYGFVFNARSRCPNGVRLLYQAVEDKVSGTSIIQEGVLRNTPFRILKADRDKVRRCAEIATRYENLSVFHRSGSSWLADFEDELSMFPRGAHDDQCDLVGYAGILCKTDDLLRHCDTVEGPLLISPSVDTTPRINYESEDGNRQTLRIGDMDVEFDDSPKWWERGPGH